MKWYETLTVFVLAIALAVVGVRTEKLESEAADLAELIEGQNEQIIFCEQRIDELQTELDEANDYIGGLMEQMETLAQTQAVPESTEQEEPELKLLGTYDCTAYCSCPLCVGPYYTTGTVYTASGAEAKQGVTVAADWSLIPPGTHIYIEGLGERIVQDKGGAIKGQKLDIYFDSHDDALKFGRQNRKVYLIGGNDGNE